MTGPVPSSATVKGKRYRKKPEEKFWKDLKRELYTLNGG
jgi:hypothetical protein